LIFPIFIGIPVLRCHADTRLLRLIKTSEDQKLFKDIVTNSTKSEIRGAAIGKITDLEFLFDIAEKDSDSNIKEMAKRRIKELKNQTNKY